MKNGCPKCGAETSFINYGGVSFVSCPNCDGFFVDFEALKGKQIPNHCIHSVRERMDGADIDAIEIDCPKCRVAMHKKRAGRYFGPLLDTCPKCKGIWFDKGEYSKYRKKFGSFLTKSATLGFKLFCHKCRLICKRKDLSSKEQLPKCPRCRGNLSFKPLGERSKPDIPKDLIAFILLIVLLLASYLGCYKLFESRFAAFMLTATVGLGGIVIILRALVYNRFAWRLTDYELDEDRLDPVSYDSNLDPK